MNSMTKMFQTTLVDGIKFLETGEFEKAKIYAEFAKAMAMTGTVCVMPSDNTDDIVEESIANNVIPIDKHTKKQDVKQEVKQEPKKEEKQEVKQEPKKEEKQEVKVQSSQQLNNIKSDKESSKAFKALDEYLEMFGQKPILQCLEKFSENTLTSMEDITNDNIDAFISYLDILASGLEA